MKTLRFFFAVCGLLFLAPSGLAQYTLNYSTNGSTITLTGYAGTPVNLTIPGFVTDIGVLAFASCASLTVVTIPSNVTNLEEGAFESCPNLSGLDISDGVTSIGGYAFADCALTNVVIPASVVSVSISFRNCFNLTNFSVSPQNSNYSSLDGVLFDKSQLSVIAYPPGRSGGYIIPDNVTNIEDDAFYDCAQLSSITIPNGVTTITAGTFLNCTSLTNLIIPGSIAFIGDDAFAGDTSLNSVYFLGNAPAVISDSFDSGTAYYLPCTSGWGTTFSGLVTEPWWQMLLSWSTNDGGITITGCSNLCGVSSLTLPATLNGMPVTSIGTNAFAGLTNFVALTLPNSVTNIEANAFAGCLNLASIYFNGNAPTADPSAFSGDTNANIYYMSGTSGWQPTLASVPTLLSTRQSQFSYTTNSGLPIGITITGYTGPPGAVIIPDIINGLPVMGIAGSAFSDNEYMTSVTIPSSVTGIGTWAFLDCPNLTAITVAAGNSSYSSVDGVLFDGSQATLIQYPSALAGTYAIPDSVNTVGDEAFAWAGGLVSVTVPESVTNLDAGAFWACTAMGSIYFLGNAPNVSRYTEIGPQESDGTPVFGPDDGLTAYYLPGTSGWSSTFGYIFESEMGIPAVAATSPAQFNYTTNGGSITITGYSGPGGSIIVPFAINGMPVTDIQGNVFDGVTNLTSVTIPGSITNIGNGAFEGCINLTNVAILYGVASIGSSAFQGCANLSAVTIAETVTSLGGSAFDSCPSLSAAYFEGNAPAAGSNLFNNDGGAIIYYSPCGTGWSSIFAGLPAVPMTAPLLFSYTPYGHALAITGYFGTCGDVIIPATLDGLPITDVWPFAFQYMDSLAQVTFPRGITNLAEGIFADCGNLSAIYFTGNAPQTFAPFVGAPVGSLTNYYLPGSTGWSNFTATTGVPSVEWNPAIQASAPHFGVSNNHFGFNIAATNNFTVVVATSTNLASPLWIPVQTVMLTNGSYYFSEPFQTNTAARFYSLQMP